MTPTVCLACGGWACVKMPAEDRLRWCLRCWFKLWKARIVMP